MYNKIGTNAYCFEYMSICQELVSAKDSLLFVLVPVVVSSYVFPKVSKFFLNVSLCKCIFLSRTDLPGSH